MLRFTLSVVAFAAIALAQSSGTISGHVVAEGSGKPIEASLTVVGGVNGVRLDSVRADDQGRFALEAPIGRTMVVAYADGYASEQVEVTVQPGRGAANLSIALKPAGSVSGRVVDTSGNGVSGARVWLQYRGEANVWRSSDEVGGEETDVSGFFRIPVVARRKPFLLHAEADGWLVSSSETILLRTPALTEVLLPLSRRGTTVSGRVLDSAGRPVANANVQLRVAPANHIFSAEQRQSIAFARTMNRALQTSDDGWFIFRGVPTGRVVVTARARDLRGDSELEVTSDSRVDLTVR